jgi:hypothetical protein
MKYFTHLITPSKKKKLKKIKKNLEYVKLEDNHKITNGGNRIIYQHPNDKDKIIKILTENNKKRRKDKKIFSFVNYNLIKKYYNFDYNIREYLFLKKYVINNNCVNKYFPKYYNFIKTNKGIGICYEYIKNDNGIQSKTVYEYIHDNKITKELKEKLNELINVIHKYNIPYHDIHPFNFLVKEKNNTIEKIIFIDGYGCGKLISQKQKKIKLSNILNYK